ncbi:MAG: PD-(D/E)XK nuclease family protein [Corallococcus sp.]|nr:PD-(D/E)XK nuclease family protein [Bacillota bacterium]MCM1533512.1 PD-(D/E)XK nuclease family protein [Corallococcus sp.]
MKSASEFVTDTIKRVDKRNLSVMHTIIVPDRASLEAERQLLKAIGGSFNAQVRTFRRLAAEILPEFEYLSKQAGIMALGSIIQDNRDRLVCYTKGVDTSGFVEDMYDTISMMKYCRISPRQLFREDLPRNVKGKVHDISLLYQAYSDYSCGRFVDSADKMDLLIDSIEGSPIVENSYFYLYDFDNLSAQELSIVEKLTTESLGVTVACCVGKNPQDKYLYLDDIYNGIMSVCAKNGITPNIIEEEKHTNSYVKQIGRNLYRYGEYKPTRGDGFIEIYQGATRVQEVYSLACRIQNYVRNGGRFKDVYVVTSDVNSYSNSVSTVFDEFDIPYFCDRQYALSAHPYARYVTDYFTLCRNNGKFSSVLPFVKNYLFCADLENGRDNDDVYLFENYCLKYNVSFRYDGFTLGKNEPYFDRVNSFREKFNALYKAVAVPPSGKVSDYVELARKLIRVSELNERNEKFAELQEKRGLVFEAKATAQSQEKFEQVLTQAERVLGGRYVKLDEFIKTLTVGIAAVKISVLPVSNDCVIFANMAKARKHDVKFLALLGANYGAMPIIKKDCKLLTDSNIKDLTNAGINVEPQIFTENKRERFSLFQLLQEPSEKLYVSYTETDGANALVPSPFVEELCKLFTVCGKPLAPTATADEEAYTEKQAIAKVVFNTRKLKDNQFVKMPSYALLKEKYADITQRYEFKKDGKRIAVVRGRELYLKNSSTSVSQLTDFFKCPYRFYIQYGLNVKPRSVAELQTADLGNILHAVLENYVRDMTAEETAEDTRSKATKCFDDALSDDFYKGMRSDPKMEGALEQLKAESIRMCCVVKEQLYNSKFKNLVTELAFGIGGDAPAVEVEFDEGKFSLVGKIDRVDVLGDKFIVIDYKSGAHASQYTERDLYVGHKMQLPVYVKAVLNLKPKLRPAGFYYFNMHNNFAEINQEKIYTYNGRTLDDVETAKAIDVKLASGASEKLGLKLNKSGDLSRQTGKLLTDEQFDNQIEYAFRLIANAGNLMSKGYAAVNPYEGVCSYCDYKDICHFGDVFVYNARKVTDKILRTTIDKTVKK